MQNSKYMPTTTSGYSSTDMAPEYKGYAFTIQANDVTDCDILLTDDAVLEGVRIIANTVTADDKVTCQIIDKDNILGQGANYIVKQFATDWYFVPGSNIYWDSTTPYVFKIKAGLYIRVKYISNSILNTKLYINARLHKVLW
jgi:hypothetical protein